ICGNYRLSEALCPGRLASGPCRLPHTRHIRARPEVVVVAKAVGAQMQMMDAALDRGFLAPALIADLSLALAANPRLRRIRFRPESRLHIQAERRKNHASRKEHGPRSKRLDIARFAQRRRKKAEPGKGQKTSSGNHPASDLQRHRILSWRNQG